ncbi:protein AATF [Trichonephila inaurata madagascariensis]|uniref:Protein AATF n=1 Tax=Trichonephila inaurata madagascariensis TaxID=2747483 RepID=A0A8X6XA69_9ARAC|nr:protein AATF [Trichonephila inaurata madagascariensis]
MELNSAAKVFTDEINETQENEISELRRKTAPLLEDVDPTYAGKKVLRRDLGRIFHEDDNSSDDDDDDLVEKTGDEVSYFEDDDGDVSDEKMKNFRKLIASKSKKSEAEDSFDNEVEEEDSIDSEDEVRESSDEEDEEETENEASDEVTKQFSNIDVTSELEKSQAINNQREIMNNLLEARIKLQKLLITVNKLPQFSVWKRLKEKGGKEFREQLSKGSKSINQVMKLWLNLQNELVNRNMEIQRSNCNGKQENGNNDDEEIPSETDEEMDVTSFPDNVEAKGIKRNLKKEDYEMVLAKHFKSLIPYRNSVIQKWDEKTKLSSGRTQKSFSAFDNSALKQIEQSLQDKSRLIKRTQLKRSVYRILGKSEPSNSKSANENEEISVSKQDMLLKDYDPEIFDDDDFYRQILKDIIESKSFGVDADAIRKQMDIQKMRNKMKRKVDTRASKGRKLRYDVHPKIVNFQARCQTSEMPDEARKSFLKCIFTGMNSSVS